MHAPQGVNDTNLSKFFEVLGATSIQEINTVLPIFNHAHIEQLSWFRNHEPFEKIVVDICSRVRGKPLVVCRFLHHKF